jgi:hypothetical protein
MRFSQIKLFLVAATATAICSCSQPTDPGVPSATPSPLASAEATPKADSTPAEVVDEAIFMAVTERYEADPEGGQNGYEILEPLLNSQLPEGMGDDLEMVSLDEPEQIVVFDAKLLPKLKEGMSRKGFVPKARLLAGEGDINYRGLRHLVGLVGLRAEQRLEQGDVKGATELVELPISLAAAMQSRPETVSVNLFSAGYASTSVAWIQGALESGALDGASIDRLQKLLAANSPSYPHLRETITVDFAQLLNSLNTEEGRGMMGIGQVEDSTLEQWRKQLLDIYARATKLYETSPGGAEAFNQTVMQAAVPIQGLVLDYPAVVAMQKRYFAEYKATELGLALVGAQKDKWKDVPSEELVEKFFKDEPETVSALNELVKIERDGQALKVVGRMEQFELLAPGVEPVLFEHQPPAPKS